MLHLAHGCLLSSGQMLRDTPTQLYFIWKIKKQVKLKPLLKFAYFCGRQHFYPFHTMNRHLEKKIVDFDPTFIASIFSASTASLGFQIKKKKDTTIENKNNKVGTK